MRESPVRDDLIQTLVAHLRDQAAQIEALRSELAQTRQELRARDAALARALREQENAWHAELRAVLDALEHFNPERARRAGEDRDREVVESIRRALEKRQRPWLTR